jgi:hypothetical protein
MKKSASSTIVIQATGGSLSAESGIKRAVHSQDVPGGHVSKPLGMVLVFLCLIGQADVMRLPRRTFAGLELDGMESLCRRGRMKFPLRCE